MSISTTSPRAVSSQATSPSTPAQQDPQDSANVSSLQPFQIEHITKLHPFFKGKQVKPLSATEQSRVMTALHTSVSWLKKAIAALDNPSSWSSETKALLSSLFPQGLRQSSERNALKAQLTHTLDGVQKQLDCGASTISSVTTQQREAGAMKIIDHGQVILQDAVHVSNKVLRDGSDAELAGVLMHEASHVYANTSDNWYNRLRPGSFLYYRSNRGADFTFTNAVNNASTVQFAVGALAGVPVDAMD